MRVDTDGTLQADDAKATPNEWGVNCRHCGKWVKMSRSAFIDAERNDKRVLCGVCRRYKHLLLPERNQ